MSSFFYCGAIGLCLVWILVEVPSLSHGRPRLAQQTRPWPASLTGSDFDPGYLLNWTVWDAKYPRAFSLYIQNIAANAGLIIKNPKKIASVNQGGFAKRRHPCITCIA